MPAAEIARSDRSRNSTLGTMHEELKVEVGVGLGGQGDHMRPLTRRPVNSRWAVCGRFAEKIEERRMWIEVEHLSEEIRRENRKFAVKMALAAVLAAGIAIGCLVPF